MNAEQVLPTRYVLHGFPNRETYAQHLCKLRRIGRQFAKGCRGHVLWIGVYPNRSDWTAANWQARHSAWQRRQARRNAQQS